MFKHSPPFIGIGPEIAAALGDGWRWQSYADRHVHLGGPPTLDRGYIDHADGRELFLRHLHETPPKIRISGRYPKYKEGPNKGCEHKPPINQPPINVSISRGPVAVAREITRRYLPAYTERYKEALKVRDDLDARYTAVADALARLHAIAPDATSLRPSPSSPDKLHIGFSDGWLTVGPGGRDTLYAKGPSYIPVWAIELILHEMARRNVADSATEATETEAKNS